MNGIYWWQSKSGSAGSVRSARRVDGQSVSGRQSISFRPVKDAGDFWGHHGFAVIMCLGLSLFFAAGLVFMIIDPAMAYLGGPLYFFSLAAGLLFSLIYPLRLYSNYRTIKNFEPDVGSGAMEVTADIAAPQSDPVVMLQYRRKGKESFASVPMSHKKGSLFSAFVPSSNILSGDDEATIQCKVVVVDGGEASNIKISSF